VTPAKIERQERKAEQCHSASDHNSEGKEHGNDGRTFARGDFLETLDFAVERVRENYASQQGDFDRVIVALRILVRPGNSCKRYPSRRLPPRLDGSELHRLVLSGVEAVLIAHNQLKR